MPEPPPVTTAMRPERSFINDAPWKSVRCVNGAFEPIEQAKNRWIGERQDLRHQNAGDLFLWIEPVIGIEQASPCQTAGGTGAGNVLCVDQERQAPFRSEERRVGK